MSNTNGANIHNVESILASIRSTIGDDRVTPFRPASAEARVEPSLAVADEASEFELPAIFKPSSMQATPAIGEARPNLFGRLTDVLKPSDDADRSRTVIRFQPAQQGRMIEPPGPEMSAAHREEPSAPEVPSGTPGNQPEPPRQMTTFFDTRMRGMSSTPKPEPKPEPAPAAPPPPLPPVAPQAAADRADAQAPGGALDDAAAQMLRPILRQWLSENMPKIVEKALQIEQVAVPRAPEGDAPPPRRTLR